METTALGKQQQQTAQTGQVQRLARRQVFTPRTDIYETADHVVIQADLPGVDEKSVDITLEKNVLTISGAIDPGVEGREPAFAEYEIGDYRRSFALSDEVERENIQAEVKDGVLTVKLPKASTAKTKKITVKGA